LKNRPKLVPRNEALALSLFSVILIGFAATGCKKQPPVQSAKEEARPSAPANVPPAGTSAASTPPISPVPAPAAPTPDYESDPLFQRAKALTNTDIRGGMTMLEEALAKSPDDPHSAPYYLLLGRLKKEYENYEGYNAGTPEASERQRNEYREYAKARPNAYFHDEPGDSYLYNGIHFKELEKRFPSSLLAAEAGYEITNLSQGGECEGQLVCFIEFSFEPVRAFLLRYPDTSHSAEAAKRADDAFRNSLWGDHWKTDWTEVTDPTKANAFYDPADLKKLVEEYEELAEKLPSRFRPRIYETVAYYRGKLGETQHARELYEKITAQFPNYENIQEIRQKLARHD
jgi:tetratricopeptide (TPR) repeat protein